jgi:type II secretory pathway pseudopilin PulG
MVRTNKSAYTILDLLTAIVVVALLMTSFAIVAANVHESADRVKCASNLRQIGTVIQLYLKEYGEWPRARYQPESADRPVAWTGAESTTPFSNNGPLPNDVTAAYRLLLAREDLVLEVFLCPKSPVADFTFASKRFNRDHANFFDERELSYSFANPYPNVAARERDTR